MLLFAKCRLLKILQYCITRVVTTWLWFGPRFFRAVLEMVKKAKYNDKHLTEMVKFLDDIELSDGMLCILLYYLHV